MRIAVVGLGKIGLPLAVQYAGKGHAVIGVDINQRTVDLINAGLVPFPGEEGLSDRLPALVGRGALPAVTEYAQAVPHADVVVVVAPLFVDDETWLPDFRWMDAATGSIAAHLRPGTLVCYETTLPVGTTRGRWRPMLERESGLREGEDFHLAYSPERVLTGRVFRDLRRYPKLVGGLSAAGAARTVAFYEAVLDFDERPDLDRPNGVWDLGSAEAAELAKLAETTYRDVNIALANQFAVFAESHQIDVHTVIKAANSQPYSHLHRPGIAVGGHCIPVYPRLYLANDPNATVVRAARLANAAMPGRAVDMLAEAVGDLRDQRVVVFGASYRSGVKETAFSGVFPLVAELDRRGAVALVHDPLYTDAELEHLGLAPYHLSEPADAAIVQTDHEIYASITPDDLPGVKAIFDGRRLLDPRRWTGVQHATIGVGRSS
jgi:UDP-N-acetyl-D-glucosamine dehydrogenase